MLAFHEQAVTQLMRTGRVGLRDKDYGNLYVSNQWDGTYKVLEWYDEGYDIESITNRDCALEQIHTWCANLEKILAP